MCVTRISLGLMIKCRNAFGLKHKAHLLLDLDPYGGADPLGMFPILLKRTANVISDAKQKKKVSFFNIYIYFFKPSAQKFFLMFFLLLLTI